MTTTPASLRFPHPEGKGDNSAFVGVDSVSRSRPMSVQRRTDCQSIGHGDLRSEAFDESEHLAGARLGEWNSTRSVSPETATRSPQRRVVTTYNVPGSDPQHPDRALLWTIAVPRFVGCRRIPVEWRFAISRSKPSSRQSDPPRRLGVRVRSCISPPSSRHWSTAARTAVADLPQLVSGVARGPIFWSAQTVIRRTTRCRLRAGARDGPPRSARVRHPGRGRLPFFGGRTRHPIYARVAARRPSSSLILALASRRSDSTSDGCPNRLHRPLARPSRVRDRPRPARMHDTVADPRVGRVTV
jgi:hypothetical protein